MMVRARHVLLLPPHPKTVVFTRLSTVLPALECRQPIGRRRRADNHRPVRAMTAARARTQAAADCSPISNSLSLLYGEMVPTTRPDWNRF